MALSQVRRWWKARPGRSTTAVPFAVACACGQVVRGLRKARHQAVRCPGCGAAVFVLGISPLPAPGGAAPPSPVRPTAATPAWRGPLLAGGLTLIIVSALFGLAFFLLLRPEKETKLSPAQEARQQFAAARAALAEEKLLQARAELAQARELLARAPGALSAAEARELTQLHRQTVLVTDLSSESLGEMLRVAAGLRPDEWEAHFERRYKGQAVIFDDVVRRDPAGGLTLATYEVRAPGEPARLDLDGLKLLKALPLQEPQRLLFGARLTAITREPPGRWVVRFDPDSGVLLTDESVAAACCPPPIDDELKAVLKRQAEWAAGLP